MSHLGYRRTLIETLHLFVNVGFDLQWNDYIGKSCLRFERALRADYLEGTTFDL